jgi:hypothetical protein
MSTFSVGCGDRQERCGGREISDSKLGDSDWCGLGGVGRDSRLQHFLQPIQALDLRFPLMPEFMEGGFMPF